jgi:hypothetical protein
VLFNAESPAFSRVRPIAVRGLCPRRGFCRHHRTSNRPFLHASSSLALFLAFSALVPPPPTFRPVFRPRRRPSAARTGSEPCCKGVLVPGDTRGNSGQHCAPALHLPGPCRGASGRWFTRRSPQSRRRSFYSTPRLRHRQQESSVEASVHFFSAALATSTAKSPFSPSTASPDKLPAH